jgi:cytochrome c biogenesis protein CcmG/thiol:disulfide interchange protein DsbE
VVLFGVVAVVVAAVWVAKVTEGSLQKVPGTIRLTGPAKTFTLDDVRTGRAAVSLEGLRGRPVVLNFFASWCEPCTREMPALQAVAERYRGRVQFVGVTFNDSRDNARKALERAGVTYPAAFDAKSTLVDDYGVRGLPTTFFIGPDGNLIERKDGEFSEVQLRKVVDRLFGSEPAVASR